MPVDRMKYENTPDKIPLRDTDVRCEVEMHNVYDISLLRKGTDYHYGI